MASLPDVYVVGAPKAGTTAVATWLANHPDVFFSTPKEPFYWASDYPGLRRHYGFESLQAYSQLFACEAARSARFLAEGSTIYLYSETAVPDILQAVPTAKMIVMLRNPADLLVSYHRTQVIALNEDERDFGRAWRRSLNGGRPRTTPLDSKLLDYPCIGRLGAAVERLLSVAPRSSVHFALYRDLKHRPLELWKQLCLFLDMDDEPRPEFAVFNASNKNYRSKVLRRLTHRPPPPLARPVRSLRQWSRATHDPRVARAKQLLWQPAPRPAVPTELRQEVAAYLEPDLHRLQQLLDVYLST